ncbi:MAG: RNA polymerase sigma factor [Planctomycetes bacterium]|nr:RNA polymerase sigma factor [Planctomycetota bacterium]
MNPTLPCPWSELDLLRPQIVTFLRSKLRDDNDVEDVVQECFLRAARHRAQEGEPERLLAWLIRVAESTLQDHLRRRHRRPALHVEAEVFDRFEGRESTPGEDPEEERLTVARRTLERKKLFECLASALRRLHPEDQRVLDFYYSGFGRCSDIARAAELDPARVKARLFRARRKLSRIVRRELPVQLDLEPVFEASGELRTPADGPTRGGRGSSAARARTIGRGTRCSAADREARDGAVRAGIG